MAVIGVIGGLLGEFFFSFPCILGSIHISLNCFISHGIFLQGHYLTNLHTI